MAVLTRVTERQSASREVIQAMKFRDFVRFDVFTAVTMKNAVFWDIEAQFIPHGKHYVSAT
jgi:hypothetical protein